MRDDEICQDGIKLPEVWGTVQCVMVTLLKQKHGSYFKAYNVFTYVVIKSDSQNNLVHYYPMQFRDEETEAQRCKGICSRLLRES